MGNARFHRMINLGLVDKSKKIKICCQDMKEEDYCLIISKDKGVYSQAIAKYGVDTDIDIQRSKRKYYLPHWLSHGSSRAWIDTLRSQTKGISRYVSKLVPLRWNSIIH